MAMKGRRGRKADQREEAAGAATAELFDVMLQ
jgi:hypothetical protein